MFQIQNGGRATFRSRPLPQEAARAQKLLGELLGRHQGHMCLHGTCKFNKLNTVVCRYSDTFVVSQWVIITLSSLWSWDCHIVTISVNRFSHKTDLCLSNRWPLNLIFGTYHPLFSHIFQFLSIFAVYKATALAKPVSRFGAVSSRLDGDERALKNAQKRAEKTAKFTKLINETVGACKDLFSSQVPGLCLTQTCAGWVRKMLHQILGINHGPTNPPILLQKK